MRHTRTRLDTRTASRQITASEMIRDLEIRVASLEREAGIADAIRNSFERIAGEITSTIELMVRKNKSKIIDALARSFQSRIGSALSGISVSNVGTSSVFGRITWESVRLKKFNPNDPASSVFSDAERYPFTLKDLFKEREYRNDLYSAYMDWTEQYGPLLARALGKNVKMNKDISVMYEREAISMAGHFGKMGKVIIKELLNLTNAPYAVAGMMCLFLIDEADHLFKKVLSFFDFTPSMGRVAHESHYREQFVRHY